jgi:tyrosyl-tRNA synthetase
MKIADIMALDAATVVSLNCPDARTEMNLINRYFKEKTPSLTLPSIIMNECLSLQLQERTLEAHKTENDEFFLLDDAKVHGKSKMKKAFCEPGNISFCPPMTFLSAFGPGEILVERSEENGGNLTYKDVSDMKNDFKSGLLHPGDLKAVASMVIYKLLESLNQAMKTNGEVLQASKLLKAYTKKKSK